MALAPADPSVISSPSSSRRSASPRPGRLRLTTTDGARPRGGRWGRRWPGSGPGRAGPRRRRRGRRRRPAPCTAQSVRGTSPNSRVPSRGSTIHTRSAASRAGSAAPSSGQDRAVGAAQRGGASELVRRAIALGPEGLAGHAVTGEAGTQVDQHVTGLGGEPGGDHVIVGVDGGHAVPLGYETDGIAYQTGRI